MTDSIADHPAEDQKLTPVLEDIEVDEPASSLPPVTHEELPPLLRSACQNAGWVSLTPVQSLGLPYLLAGRDIMVQSRTGSGKTGCYLLPMLVSLDPAIKAPQALVLVPTRELAAQVEREASTLMANSGLNACAIYGGVSYKRQVEELQAGAQIIIGTPGRILDHLLRKSLNFENLRVLVFDEADRMLSIGFYPDILQIARYLPRKRRTSLFSATYPPHVFQLAAEFMSEPELLSLSRREVHVPQVEHLYCQVKPMDKDRALVRLLEVENPASAIIFCNTKSDVHYVAGVLKGFGYRADELSADISQKKRESVLAAIRNGELRYLVATDVAARGIDIPDLSHVFLYSPPEDHEGYIHRAGRTGRAGAAGTVISLVDLMEELELKRIASRYKIDLRQLKTPDDGDVAKSVSERVRTLLEGRLRSLTGLENLRASRYLPLAREMNGDCGDGDSNSQLVALLLDDFHRATLNESRYPHPVSRDGMSTKKTTKKRNSRHRGRGQKRTAEQARHE